MFLVRIAALAAAVFLGVVAVTPAQAVTMTQCSTLYKSAQTAGTLNGMKWNDFRKANCGTTTPVAVTTAPLPKSKPSSGGSEPTVANTDNATEPPADKTAPPRGVIFPTAVAAQYNSETPGKARMHTCLDQYRIDKANNDLAGLTWIKAGGGYYSICNTRLKG